MATVNQVTCQYAPGKGIYVHVPGRTFLLPEDWSIIAIERYVQALEEFYS